MNELAKILLQYFEQPDLEIEARISEGIESYRKGFGKIILQDKSGRLIPKASVRLVLKQHHYHFGCNLFMLDQFPEKEKNALYEDRFKEIFNLGVLPFYWSDFEVTPGRPRFEKTSEPVYRRPPPDRCLEYCEQNRIIPKGHPLLWHQFWPGWLAGDHRELRSVVERRFREISARYGSRLPIWDVANEAQTVYGTMPLPDHVALAFTLAEKYFSDCTLTYNDDRLWWNLQGDYSPVYLLARSLQMRGLRLDALGFQYHMFDGHLAECKYFMNPRHLFAVLDQYQRLGVPINLSEISLISRRDLGDGDEFQARLTRHLYRLWFSHPATNGAVWWNLVDGTAAFAPLGSEEGENRLRAGLVNHDLTPKKAFTELKNLVTREWHTHIDLDYAQGAPNQFRGFYGTYQVSVEGPGFKWAGEKKLSPEQSREWRIITEI